MLTKIVEVTNQEFNWGKFLVMRPSDEEWERRSVIDSKNPKPLLSIIGWEKKHIWLLDLQTGEGAYFWPGGIASADLTKHQIWVCPLFEPFLEWLYQQDLSDLATLPDMVKLPAAPAALYGARRPGPGTNSEKAKRTRSTRASRRL